MSKITDSEIRALRRQVRVQGVVLCLLLVGWILSATPAASVVNEKVLNSFPEILSYWSDRFDRASKAATQTTNTILRVKEIQIANDRGNTVGILGVDEDGSGVIVLTGPSGAENITFSGNTPSDTIFGLSVNEQRLDTGLFMASKDGPIAGLLLDRDGVSGLVIADDSTNEGTIIRLRTTEGNPELTLGGRIHAVVDPTGKGVVETRGPGGSLIWSSENANVGNTSGLLGDLDGDGDVDIADFLLFTENFGKSQ